MKILKLFLITYSHLAISAPYLYGMESGIADHTSFNAVQSANKATPSADRHIEQIMQQGDAYYQQKDYLSATVIYQEALQKYGQYHSEKSMLLALISHKIGISYLGLNIYPKSYLYLHHALSIGQTCLSMVTSSGHDLLKENIRKAISKSHYHIGCLYIATNNPQAAIQSFQAALEIESSAYATPNEAQPVGDTVADIFGRDIVGNTGLLTHSYQQEKDGQIFDKAVLAQQVKDVKKEKPLSQIPEKTVKIGGSQNALPPLNMATFPQFDVILPSLPLQVQKVPCAPKKRSPKAKSLSRKKRHRKTKNFSGARCGQDFSEKDAFILHMRVHTGEKSFTCHLCDKKFALKSNMKVHLRVMHTGEKNFACHLCDKKFALKSNMKTHLRVHTGEKPFPCPVCGKKFAIQSNRKRHLRTHTGEKPFSCHVCHKGFTLKQNMQVHLRIHTGEKPFSCSFCDKKFSRKENLIIHIRTHTGEKPFNCPVCEKKFMTKNNMKKHMERHTRGNFLNKKTT